MESLFPECSSLCNLNVYLLLMRLNVLNIKGCEDMSSEGKYAINQFNECRHGLWEDYYSKDEGKAGNWVAHKALSVVSIPVNGAVFVAGTAGLAASSCTLVAFKVMVFAVTLGNIKPEFETGCTYFAWSAIYALAGGLTNIYELAWDVVDLGIKTLKGVQDIAEALNMNHLSKKIKEIALKCIGKLTERIEIGFQSAGESEKGFDKFSFETPTILKWINEPTKSVRIDTSKGERPFSDIIGHSVASLVNIPLNTVVAGVSVVGTVTLGSAFMAKVVIKAVTNLDTPIPTFAVPVFSSLCTCTANVVTDASCNLADVAVLTYKVADGLKLTKALAGIFDILAYIPRAAFG
jgi:hypothetical protein